METMTTNLAFANSKHEFSSKGLQEAAKLAFHPSEFQYTELEIPP